MKDIAIIYDLDDTILPTRSIPENTFAPVFDAIRFVNDDIVSKSSLELAFKELWRKPIDVVALDYGFSDRMIDAGKNALINTEYKFTLNSFEDFHVIRNIRGKRVLVTTGITKLQQAKINALFLIDDFDEIIIDDPYQDNRLGKKKIFAQVAERLQLSPEQVWIIGDNPDSEIAAGNALGMITVQILRPGVVSTNSSTYVVSSFYELKNLIANVETKD